MIRVGPLQVDLSRRAVLVDGKPARLGSRAFEILALLIEAEGGLVAKREIINRVWPEAMVGDSNVHVHMSALRKLLGESRELIGTVAGRGYRLVLEEAPAAASARPAHTRLAEMHCVAPDNLPAHTSALIGRDSVLDEVGGILGSTRHLTIVGAGGIGKTSIATEVARQSLDRAPDGVLFVSLGSAVDAGTVLAAVHSAIGAVIGHEPGAGVDEGPTLTFERVVEAIASRGLLIVLDGCEHVIWEAAALAHRLLSECPMLRMVSTSREPLRIPSENLYRLAPLAVPDHDDDTQAILDCSSVELFMMRLRAVDASYSLDEDSIHLMGTVCRRLDGLPLAIELAAARAAVLGIDTFAAHLDDYFDLLTGGPRTASPRHRTLKATLDWSYALLDETERSTLRRVATFSSSFTMDAAIAVSTTGATCELGVVATIAALVEKSLVVACREPGCSSFRLLEATRAYARQKLDDTGESRLAEFAHARYIAALLDHEARRSPRDPEDSHRRRSMCAWFDDVRAALHWARSEEGDAALCESLAGNALRLLHEVRAPSASRLPFYGRLDELRSEVLSIATELGHRAFEARAVCDMPTACQASGDARGTLGESRCAERTAASETHLPGRRPRSADGRIAPGIATLVSSARRPFSIVVDND